MSKSTKQIDKVLKLYQLGNFNKAQEMALKLLNSEPKNTKILNLLALIYNSLNKLKLSKECYLKVLQIDNRDFSAYNNLGLIYFSELDFKEAKYTYKKALEINPGLSTLYANFGNVYLEEQNYDEAEKLYLKALSLGINSDFIFHNLAKLYMAVDQAIKSEEMFEAAIAKTPFNSNLLFEYSLLCLRQKNYLKGFDLYRYRYHTDKKDKQTFLLSQEKLLERGVNIDGKRLVLTYEQGYGDIIQFIRYALMYKEKGAKVYIQSSELLFELFQKSYPAFNFLYEGEMVEYDYHIPLLDAPYYFSTKYETVPFSAGYINVNGIDAKKIRDRFFKDETKRKVGIVWRTNLVENEVFTKQKERMSRNCSLEDFLVNFDSPAVQLYSLQVNVTDEERILLNAYGICSLGDNLVNFYDNALIIDNLDVVIGIDTVSILLAGAMGKEAVVMLSRYSDWRWTSSDDSTNWFKSIKIVRQEKKDEWSDVFKKVCELENLYSDLSNTENMLNMGIAYHQKSKIEDAERLYRQVLKLDSENASAYHYLGLIAFKSGHTEHAIALIQKSIELDPNNDEAYENLRNILNSSAQNIEKKIEYFNDIFQIDTFNKYKNKEKSEYLSSFFRDYQENKNAFQKILDTKVLKILNIYLDYNYRADAIILKHKNIEEFKGFFYGISSYNSLLLEPQIRSYIFDKLDILFKYAEVVKTKYFSQMNYLAQNYFMYWYTTLRDGIDESFIEFDYVLLINDTTNFYHPGCNMTSEGIKQILLEKYDKVIDIPIHEIYFGGNFFTITKAEQFDNVENYHILQRELPIIDKKLANAKEIIINGEGTLHNKNLHVVFLLYLAYIAKVKYKKRVSIINHSPYPSYSSVNRDFVADEMYKKVYKELDFIGIREPIAKSLMDGLGISSKLTFDCSGIYLNKLNQELLSNVSPYSEYIVLSASVIINENAKKIFKNIINKFVKDGKNIILLNGGPDEEKIFLESLYTDFKAERQVSFLETKSVENFLSIIKNATMLISGRFHYSIIAMFLQCPFVLLSSNTPKNIGLIEMTQLPNQVLRFSLANLEDELLAEIENIEQSPQQYILGKEQLDLLTQMAKNNFI